MRFRTLYKFGNWKKNEIIELSEREALGLLATKMIESAELNEQIKQLINGKEVFIVGSGYSLEDSHLRAIEEWKNEDLNGRVIIAINRTEQHIKHDALVAMDLGFWENMYKHANPNAIKILTNSEQVFNKIKVKNIVRLMDSWKQNSSGLRAIEIAQIYGAKQINIIGFEAQVSADGRRYFWDKIGTAETTKRSHYYLKSVTASEKIKQHSKVAIYNYSVETALKFDRKNINDLIKEKTDETKQTKKTETKNATTKRKRGSKNNAQ